MTKGLYSASPLSIGHFFENRMLSNVITIIELSKVCIYVFYLIIICKSRKELLPKGEHQKERIAKKEIFPFNGWQCLAVGSACQRVVPVSG